MNEIEPVPGIKIILPGILSYQEALELQLRMHSEVCSGNFAVVLIILEHFCVITLGASFNQENLLVDEGRLTAEGITLARTDRGGDATYHGPGQLVGYPIVNLRAVGSDVHGFLRLLEDIIIQTIAEFGVHGGRNGPAGVWVDDRKICSIGIAIRRGVSYHGFALNISPNLSHFSYINPCGLQSDKITSLERIVDSVPSMDDVKSSLIRHFTEAFRQRLECKSS